VIMIIDESKTKEIVFRRPSPKRLHNMFPSVDGIELVDDAKLLGVILHNTFSVEMHVTYILSICSQRIILLKRLRDQGLPAHYVDLAFHAIVVSRIFYALPVWGSCLSSEQINRINTLFKRSYRCGFAKQINDNVTLVDNASKDLFGKTMAPHHCLHSILPLQTEKNHDLRTRVHNLLSQCKYNVHRNSF